MRSGWWHKYRNAKKTLRKSLALPLHASLHRALFFCSASQMWEKVLKLPELQFILFFKDRLIQVFCQPCSHCTMHFYAWPVKLPKHLPKQSVSSKHLWQQNSSWKSCICVLAKTILGSSSTGSVKSREECLPTQHLLNPSEVTCHFNTIIISDTNHSVHSWTMPVLFLSLSWSIICLCLVQLNYFLNLFIDQFPWLMVTFGCC